MMSGISSRTWRYEKTYLRSNMTRLQCERGDEERKGFMFWLGYLGEEVLHRSRECGGR